MRGLGLRAPGRYLLALCVLTMATAVHASQVRPVNLEEMTEHAATIFAGVVVETQTTLEPVAGREVAVTVFQVDRAVKGDVGSTATVRMLGGADGQDGVVGMPRFRPGDEVVLFLYGESKLGLSSPVGLGQGRFTVLTDKQGRRIAVNDFANKSLLRNLSPSARTRLGSSFDEWKGRKDVEPDALLDMVESLASANP